jgi:hypothetical protein
MDGIDRLGCKRARAFVVGRRAAPHILPRENPEELCQNSWPCQSFAGEMGNTVAQPGAKIKFGHRVLEVTPGSPSAEALLVPYVDVIVAINDVPLVRLTG